MIQGLCAGALLTIDGNLPGAAAHPLPLSKRVSACDVIVNAGTSVGVADVAPVFRLTLLPLIYMSPALAYEPWPPDPMLIVPLTLILYFPNVYPE